jgi:hypothetical protein
MQVQETFVRDQLTIDQAQILQGASHVRQLVHALIV